MGWSGLQTKVVTVAGAGDGKGLLEGPLEPGNAAGAVAHALAAVVAGGEVVVPLLEPGCRRGPGRQAESGSGRPERRVGGRDGLLFTVFAAADGQGDRKSRDCKPYEFHSTYPRNGPGFSSFREAPTMEWLEAADKGSS